MYVEWCLGHIGVSYAKAIYFWRLAAPKICIAEDARPQILSLHHLLLTLLRGTIILLRRYPSDSYSYPCLFIRHKSPFSSSTINLEISRFFNKNDYPSSPDDSPGRSSILLYIPYVTFTMGSKEARNGRPVLQA